MTVKTIAAREAKNRFGALLDTAQREPVRITKKDRPVAVVLSGHDYEEFALTQQEHLAARKKAVETFSAQLPDGDFSGLSEQEIMEIVRQEITDRRSNG